MQLPAGSSLASSKAAFKISTKPVVDSNGLLTWTIPNPNNNLNLNLKIMYNTCVPKPDLEGLFCYGDNCQGLPVPKQVSVQIWGCIGLARLKCPVLCHNLSLVLYMHILIFSTFPTFPFHFPNNTTVEGSQLLRQVIYEGMAAELDP